MPVWHEITKPLREQYDFRVIGIVQEQHFDRAKLFAQWKQWKAIDFPLAWDPFGVTRSKAVPRVFLIDENGIVVKQSPTPEEVVEFAKGAPEDSVSIMTANQLPELDGVSRDEIAARTDLRVAAEMGRVLFQGVEDTSALIDALTMHLDERPEDAATSHFRLGVAYRMRHDSRFAEPGDFQAAIDHWSAALALDPSQYIWRRRIQQYGPLLDKPYPFYDWVDTARAEIRARGETPIALPVALSRTERLGRVAESADVEASPDPNGMVPLDDGSWLDVRTTLVPDTQGRGHVVRVHVETSPQTDIHWNNEVDGPVLWVDGLPDGWSAAPRGQRGDLPPLPISDETRAFDVELRGPEGADLLGSGTTVTLTLFFHACEEEVGVCIYMRRDVEVAL